MVSKKAKTVRRLKGARLRDKSITTLIGFGKWDEDGWLPLEHVARGGKVLPRPGDCVEIRVRMSGVMKTIANRSRNGLSDEELIHRALGELLGQTGGYELVWEDVPVKEPIAKVEKPKPVAKPTEAKE